MGKRKVCTKPDTPCGISAKIKLEEIRRKYYEKLSMIPDIETGAFSRIFDYIDEAVNDEIVNMYISKLKVNYTQIGKLKGNIPSNGYCNNKSNELKNRIMDNLITDSTMYMKELQRLYPTYNQDGKVDSDVEIPDMIWKHRDYINFKRTMVGQREGKREYHYTTDMYEDFHTSYTIKQKESNVMARMLYNMIINNEECVDILRSNTDFLNAEVMLLKQLIPDTKCDYYIEKLPDGMFKELLGEIKDYQSGLQKQDEKTTLSFTEDTEDKEFIESVTELAETEVEIENAEIEEEQIDEENTGVVIEEENTGVVIEEDEVSQEEIDNMGKRERKKFLKNYTEGQYSFKFDLEA